MMETIYGIYKSNLAFFGWASAIVNCLLVGWMYFNKQRHEKELIQLKAKVEHEKELEFEKRKKLYGMKTEQFEKYFHMVDEFNKKQNAEIPKRIQPLFSVYMKSMLETGNDQNLRNEAILAFSDKVHTILADGIEDYMKIQTETHCLKLVATEALGEILTRLEKLYGESFHLSQQFLNEFTVIFGDQAKVDAYTNTIRQKGLEMKETLVELMEQMRQELQQI